MQQQNQEEDKNITVNNSLLMSILSQINELKNENKQLKLYVERVEQKNKLLEKEIKNTRSELKSRASLHQEESEQQLKNEIVIINKKIKSIEKNAYRPRFSAVIVNYLMLLQEAKEEALTSDKPIRKQLLKRLNQFSINQHPVTVDLIAKELKRNLAYQEELLSIVYQSRDDDTIIQASVNSMTLLKAANFCFAGKDFRRVRIPGVNLSNTMLMQTDFSGADLTGVDFLESNLQGACFKEAILSGVCFGQWWRLGAAGSYGQYGVKNIAYGKSKEGNLRLAALAVGKCVTLYDAKTWEVLQISEQDKSLWCFAYSLDGQQFALGRRDSTIKLWDLASNICKKTLVGHRGAVDVLLYLPNGEQLVSGSEDSSIKLWNLLSGTCERTLSGHTSYIYALACSLNNQQLASGSWDKTIKLWSLFSGTCERTLFGHEDAVNAIVYLPNGCQLASGSSDKTIRLWNLHSGVCEKILVGHHRMVASLSCSPNGQQLASGSYDCTIKLWNLTIGSCEKTFFEQTGYIYALAYSPDGQQLASGTGAKDCAVRLWNVSSIFHERSLNWHTASIESLAYLPNGLQIASGSSDKTVKLWDVSSNHCEKTLTLACASYSSNTFVYSPNGLQIASTEAGKSQHQELIKLWELSSGRCEKTLLPIGNIYALAYSPNNLQIASGGSQSEVKLWNVASGLCEKTLVGHRGAVCAITYSPNGQYIASGGSNNELKLWDVNSGVCKWSFMEKDQIEVVAYSPNSQYIAAGGKHRTVKLWDVNSGLCQKKLELAEYWSGVGVLAYSPNDLYIIASHKNSSMVKLFSVETGVCLIDLSFDGYHVKALRFTVNTTSLKFPREQNDLQIGLVHEEYNYVVSLTLRWQEDTKTFKWIQVPSTFHLNCKQLNLTDAVGLSPFNAQLLKQYGALGEPSDKQPPPKEGVSILSTSTNPQSFLTSKNNASKRTEKKSLIESGNFLEFN